MVSKVVAISVLLYTLGAIASCVLEDFRVLFFGTAVVCLIAIVTGSLVFPLKATEFLVELPISDKTINDCLVIAGQEFRVSPYRKVLVCRLSTSNLQRLFASVAVSVGTLYVLTTGHYSSAPFKEPGGLFGLESITLLGLYLLLNSLQWLVECARLSGTALALAWSIGPPTGGMSGKLTFNFIDHNGDRRGGTSPLPPKKGDANPDNLLLVFFREDDPDDNISQHALRFHRLSIELAPAVNLPMSQAEFLEHRGR